MLRHVLALIAAVAATGSGGYFPPNVTAAAVTPARTKTLPNGLEVVVVEDHRAAVVETAMYYRFGSFDETAGTTGLAHALEHMMFRGTTTISAGGFDEVTTRLGAIVNADTNEDYTRYYIVLPADRLDLALRLESDRMRGLLLRARDWNLERGAVLSEIDSDASAPANELQAAVRAQAFRGSPFARSPLGLRPDVASARVETLRAYYDRYYVPNNATLVVTGDVTAADVFRRAEAVFGAIPRGGDRPQSVIQTPAASSASSITIRGDSPGALVDVAFRIPGDAASDAASAQIMAPIIENHGSPFYRALVESKLAEGYHAVATTSLDFGIMHVTIRVAPSVRPASVQRAFQDALTGLLRDGIDPQLLTAAVNRNTTGALFARDSITGLSERFGYALAVERRDPDVDDERAAALKPADVNAALGKWFAEPAVVGVLLPEGRSASAHQSSEPPTRLESFAANFRASPVVLPQWARDAESRPILLQSKVRPRLFVLRNGIRLFVEPVRANKSVMVAGSISVSPSFEPPGKTGTARLVSRLMGDGGTRLDRQSQRRIIERMGADVSFGLDFSARGRSTDFGAIIALLADAERRTNFPARDVAFERSRELARASDDEKDADTLAQRALSRGVYSAKDPILRVETARSLEAIRPADVREYARRMLRPERTTIVVVGDVEPANVLAQTVAAFEDWRAVGRPPFVPSRHIPSTRASVTTIGSDRPVVSLAMARRAAGRADADFYALYLLNRILGGDNRFDTRLMTTLRTQNGLVYGASSRLLGDRDVGVFEINMEADPNHIRLAEALTRREIRRLWQQPVGARELRREKNELVATTLVEEESTLVILQRILNIARFRLPVDYYAGLAARYEALTPRDLMRVSRRYLRPDDFAEVFVGTVQPRS